MTDLAPETPNRPHGLEATLKKKVIGPVPLWLVIGVGGGVLLLLIRRRSGGGSTPDPTTDAASGAVDATGGDPGLGAGGVGSTVDGPTGNLGGVEDPIPPFVDFGGGGDFGTSANPPANDPVFNSSFGPGGVMEGLIPDALGGGYSPGWDNPDVQHNLVLIGQEYARTHPDWANPDWRIGPAPQLGRVTPGGGWAVVGGARRLSAIVHPIASPPGRIAAATSPFTIGPNQTTVHVSEGATAAAKVFAV